LTFAQRAAQLEYFYGAARRYSHRLKKAVYWTIGVGVVGFGIGLWWRQAIFEFLIAPADGRLSPFDDGLPVILAPIDGFGSVVGVAFRVGLIGALPVFTVGALITFKPLIAPKWLWFLATFFIITFLCFLAGAAFAYLLIVPAMVKFLFGFIEGFALPVITLGEWVSMLTQLMFYIGLIFELPPAMYLLSRYRMVSYETFRKYWRFSVPISIILAVFITPSIDGFNMWLVAAPMIILYQVGLFFAWLAHPKEGNYLWLSTIGRRLRKVCDGIAWVLRRPVVIFRWVYRKAKRMWEKIVALAREELGIDQE
jgi:sec-independent protein translocase protein TatC